MLFHYSDKSIFSVLRIYFLLILLNTIIGITRNGFYWIPLLFVFGAIYEFTLRSIYGYFKITEDEIIRIYHPFFKKRIKIEDITETLSYDNEWTFRTDKKELRINKNHIMEKQLDDFENKLLEIRKVMNRRSN